jgi:hypothetical protein
VNPLSRLPVTLPKDDAPPFFLRPNLKRVLWKSALLNLVIVATALPVITYSAGPKSVVPALAVLAAVSVLVWTSTLAVFSAWSLVWIAWTQARRAARRSARRAESGGVGDPWVDGTT